MLSRVLGFLVFLSFFDSFGLTTSDQVHPESFRMMRPSPGKYIFQDSRGRRLSLEVTVNEKDNYLTFYYRSNSSFFGFDFNSLRRDSYVKLFTYFFPTVKYVDSSETNELYGITDDYARNYLEYITQGNEKRLHLTKTLEYGKFASSQDIGAFRITLVYDENSQPKKVLLSKEALGAFFSPETISLERVPQENLPKG